MSLLSILPFIQFPRASVQSAQSPKDDPSRPSCDADARRFRVLHLAHVEAAVYVKDLACYVGGFVAGQEDYRGGYVLVRAEAA